MVNQLLKSHDHTGYELANTYRTFKENWVINLFFSNQLNRKSESVKSHKPI